MSLVLPAQSAAKHLREETQTPLIVPKNGTSRENKKRDHAQLLTQVVSKDFPHRSSTQSLKSTICCKKPTSPILSCYAQEQLNELLCLSKRKILLNVDENLQSFLSYHLEKICHFQVF